MRHRPALLDASRGLHDGETVEQLLRSIAWAASSSAARDVRRYLTDLAKLWRETDATGRRATTEAALDRIDALGLDLVLRPGAEAERYGRSEESRSEPEGFNNPNQAARRDSWIRPPSTSLRSTGGWVVPRTCGGPFPADTARFSPRCGRSATWCATYAPSTSSRCRRP